MLKYVAINKENLELAKKIQNEIFPDHDASKNYEESVCGVTENRYYLVQNEAGEFVGVSGLYRLPCDPESAWLGWFGILKQYRRKGYGSKTIRLFEAEAHKLGYLYCRFYADRFNNDTALDFYRKNGYSLEVYETWQDPASFDFPILVGGKSISDSPLKLWANRNMGFTAQIFKQTGFIPQKLSLERLDDVTLLYEECFLNNPYFQEEFKGKDLKQIIDTSFKDIFAYCLQSGYSYGIFRGNELIGFSLCFEFFELKEKDIRKFNNVFTGDYDHFDYPYKNEFHSKVDSLRKPVMYILAVAVKQSERSNGIASRLIDNVILNFANYTVISDVTSRNMMKIFTKRHFSVAQIDKEYFLVYKEKATTCA